MYSTKRILTMIGIGFGTSTTYEILTYVYGSCVSGYIMMLIAGILLILVLEDW